MAARPFEAGVRFRPGVAIVDLHGELDATGEDALQAAYAHASSRSPDTILLNFSDVPFMDTTGIALIGDAHGQGARRGAHRNGHRQLRPVLIAVLDGVQRGLGDGGFEPLQAWCR